MWVNTTTHVKLSNVESVRTALLESADTKIGLSRRTGLSFATCATIIREMATSGEVIPGEQVLTTGGRPSRVYHYNPHYAHILGLYVSNAAGNNEIVCSTSTSIGDTISRAAFSPVVIDCRAIESIITGAIEQDSKIKAIGIGVPGIVHRGAVGECDVADLRGVPLAEKIREKFALPTVVENDMNLTAFGYYHRHAGELDSLVVVILPKGNGPGTGIIVDGKMLRGHSGFAGEVHSLPDDYNSIFQTARDEETLLPALAKMLATVIVMVNPQRIVLTGGLLHEGVVEPLVRICHGLLPPQHCPELVFQEDCGDEYLEGLRLKTHESLRYHNRPAPGE